MSIRQLYVCSHLQLPGWTVKASSCYSLGLFRPAAEYSQWRHTAATAQDPEVHQHHKHKVASHPESWNEVAPLVVVCAGWSSLHRRPHAVPVVLTDEDARQLPQSGHVKGLKQLALVGSERTSECLNINSFTASLSFVPELFKQHKQCDITAQHGRCEGHEQHCSLHPSEEEESWTGFRS